MTSFDRIKRVLIEEMGIQDDIKPSASFVSLGLDSLEMAQLVIELEEEFGIEIPDDDMKTIVTVQDVMDKIPHDPRSQAV